MVVMSHCYFPGVGGCVVVKKNVLICRKDLQSDQGDGHYVTTHSHIGQG